MKFIFKKQTVDPNSQSGLESAIEKETPLPLSVTEKEPIALPEKTEERKTVKFEKEKERREMALNILDEKSRATLISKLNIELAPEKQLDITNAFSFYVGNEVVPQLLNAGVDPALLQNPSFENLTELEKKIKELKISLPEKFAKWDTSTEAALKKLIEVLKNKESNFTEAWQKEWPAILNSASFRYKEAEALRDTHPSLWEKTKTISEETYNYIMNHKVETALIVTGAVAAGWFLKKIFGRKKEEKPGETKIETKKGGFIGKWTKRLLYGTLGLGTVYILAKIIPIDKVKKWLEDLFSFSKEEKIEKQEKNIFYEKVAEEMGIEDSAFLEVMEEYKYKDFMSFIGEIKGAARGKTRKFFADAIWGNFSELDISKLPIIAKPMRDFIQKRKEYPQKIEDAEEKLRVFLKRHEKIIEKIYPNTSVKDVLEGLGREGIFGPEFANKPMPLKEKQVPMAVQVRIQENYPVISEQNKVRSFSFRVFEEHKEFQKENIFGKKGLIQRMKVLAQKDPSYEEKINNMKNLYKTLEDKREAFSAGVAVGASIMDLEVKMREVLETQKKLEKTVEKYYSETQPHFPLWAPLPYFGLRYAMFPSHIKASRREQFIRVIKSPFAVKETIESWKNPLEYVQKRLKAAKKELEVFESEKGVSPTRRQEIKETTQATVENAEWRNKIINVEVYEKRVLLEQKRETLKSLSGINKTNAEIEVLKLEKEYLTSRQDQIASGVDHLKSALKDTGANLSRREKNELFHDLNREQKSLRDAIKDFDRQVVEMTGKLGKMHPEIINLANKREVLLQAHRKLAKEEFSLWNRVIGESKGLRNQFVEWLREEHEAGLIKMVKNEYRPGRIAIAGLTLMPAMYGIYKEAKEKDPEAGIFTLGKELGLPTLQLLADVMPLTFGFSDWYTVKTGKEIVTGRFVKGWDRYGRAVWGCIGALLDAGVFIPGVNLADAPINAIMRLGRATGRMAEATKLIKMWPKIRSVAEDMPGGWKEFGKRLLKYIKEKPALLKTTEKGRIAVKTATVLGATTGTFMVIDAMGRKLYYTLGNDAYEAGEAVDEEIIKETEKLAQTEKRERIPEKAA